MTGYHQPEGNAYVERVIRTVKEEEIWLSGYRSFEEALERIERFIRFYNEQRIHSALGYKSPVEFIKSLYEHPATSVGAS